MVPRRTPLIARFVSLAPFTALGLAACSLMHHGAAAGDGGTTDGSVAVAVLDAAGAAPPATPDNVNQVGRFPDEVTMNDATAKIADPQVAARNAVPGGALVATLRLGTPVTQVAKHDTFILCIFPDPKNAAHTLEGWIAEQAFVSGPTVPAKGGCPVGQTRLMVDEQDFCGRVCKNDSDCQAGQVCEGKASVLANGKTGAEVTTCTLSSTGAGSAPPAVLPPGPGNVCITAGFLFDPADKLCHRDCSKAPCPGKSHCGKVGALSLCEQ